VTQERSTRWWLFGLPALICLPCVLPAVVAGLLAAGGFSAIGSFLSGLGGLSVLAVGAALVASGGTVYARWRIKRRRLQA